MKITKYTLFCLAPNLLLCGLTMNAALAWSSGPPAYRTGAPGDTSTCNAVDCHSTFTTNSGSASFAISGDTTYTPGKAVKLEVSFSNSSGKKHGFEMTAVDAGGNRVGTFKKIGNTTQVIPTGDYRELDTADKNKYIEHTYKGMKKKIWKIKWTPPSGATDPITFYAAGCEADGKSTADDDYIYTATLEVSAK
jgi:hypothetical protein